jgi:hypothetical protein
MGGMYYDILHWVAVVYGTARLLNDEVKIK